MKYKKRQALEACSNVETVHVDASLDTASSFHINEEDIIIQHTTYTAPIYVAETHAAFLGLKQIYNHASVRNFDRHTTYQLHTKSYPKNNISLIDNFINLFFFILQCFIDFRIVQFNIIEVKANCLI